MPPALLIAIVLASGPPAAGSPDWMSDEHGVLELRLAHLHPGRIDGGTLRLDRTKRLVEWIGAPGEIGCKDKVEARFDDVKSVAVDEVAPGFLLELKTGKPKSLRLIPLPHAQWLLKQPKMQEAIATAMKYGTEGLNTPDGKMAPTGSAAGGGPTLKTVEIPKDVAADTKKAVDALKEALGR
jgi:hypothetical protein